jgi:hypothetical protein
MFEAAESVDGWARAVGWMTRTRRRNETARTRRDAMGWG